MLVQIKHKKKEEDYYLCLYKLATNAGYLTINISSPNTEGLRDFHDQNELEKLLKGINKIRGEKYLKTYCSKTFSRYK